VTEQAVFRVAIRIMLLAVLLGLLLWFGWTVRGTIATLLIGAILATGLAPVVGRISAVHPKTGKRRMSRRAATVLLYLALAAVVVVFVLVVIPPLLRQAQEYLQAIVTLRDLASQELLSRSQESSSLAEALEGLAGVVVWVLVVLERLVTQLAGTLNVAVGIGGTVADVLMILLLMTYLLVDSSGSARWLVGVLPKAHRTQASEVLAESSHRIGGWLTGQIILCGVIGACTFVGLTIIGMPYALLLAVIAAVCELIPLIGPILAGIPALIVAVFISPEMVVLVFLLYFGISQFENNLVVPVVMRRRASLPPVVTLVAVLAGAEAFGFVGAILALPVAAAISVLVDTIIAVRNRTEAADASSLEDSSQPTGSSEGASVGL